MQLALLEISLCSSVILPLWRGPKAATTQKQTFPAEGLLPKSQPASQPAGNLARRSPTQTELRTAPHQEGTPVTA